MLLSVHYPGLTYIVTAEVKLSSDAAHGYVVLLNWISHYQLISFGKQSTQVRSIHLFNQHYAHMQNGCQAQVSLCGCLHGCLRGVY